ncbi:oxidoreductase [Actinophytocola algeriensis]|uniref:NAD(P)-dependent dehydrogenase (Short-subunit alcohol dehydrogenase family) n=1 Tax=Actinophytocola algeriensis TaxID=1768010 RepID=A0A7W7Q4I8_9PSEU|nr:oxidoreductase [Actinophytocola algeriensis]MBB4906772.1 NAD(P)-dependent dehydrogenase (short-subunit alcohol dehydrogenase family) [Actinophytocola algeriensis]MBE1478253.1 NAD(P)-dependent dehydrogenase (short-subunit alcohol dehydrogenase family) [Actinophytocola algeriensis]
MAEGDRPSAADWLTEHVSSQVGRVFVVTGANSGLGLETARALGALGGSVIMAVRDTEKGAAAVEALRAEQPDGRFDLRHLDLADLDSVREFAAGVEHVDVLVNNAGVMMPPRTLTEQGYELQFGVNHLAHFALTILLFNTLLQAEDPRVVTVSSGLHKRGRIHFEDLHGEHGYHRTKYYSQSKLANVVFALELHRRLRTSGFPLRSVLAHPGYAATNLQSAGPTGVGKLILKVTNRVMAQEVEMGALPQVYAAVGADVESGQFWGPDGRKESKGFPTLVEPLDEARDRELGKRLWDISEELTGVHIDLTP